MRKISIIAVLSLLVVAIAAVPVLAANPHFVVGPNATDEGTQLRVGGSIAGLGNENIDILVSAEGVADVTCTNPGGNVAPGQDTTVSTTGSVEDLQVKNGRATFNVLTDEPAIDSSACPNNKWTASAQDVDFTSFRVQVFQGGVLVLDETSAV